jgi:hypothetical protein
VVRFTPMTIFDVATGILSFRAPPEIGSRLHVIGRDILVEQMFMYSSASMRTCFIYNRATRYSKTGQKSSLESSCFRPSRHPWLDCCLRILRRTHRRQSRARPVPPATSIVVFSLMSFDVCFGIFSRTRPVPRDLFFHPSCPRHPLTYDRPLYFY